MSSYFFWNQNPHVVGSLHRWQPIPFLYQKHLPSLQLAYADQSHRELHSAAMDDTHTDLFRRYCSWEQQKSKRDQRDMAFFLLTETNLPHDLKEDYPNGNLILREDYQKSFKKEVRWKDIKSFLKTESFGEVYPSYSNGEKDRYVCRPSRQNGVHDGFDRRKQAVKMADVFCIEKV